MAESRFPHLLQAMHDAARLVHEHWQAVAARTLRTPGERDAYVSGLQSPESVAVVEDGSTLRATITNVSSVARRIETGHPAYHLPSRINWAEVRSKSGKSFLIIPFRHYSAQRGSRAQASSPAARRAAMPRPIYNVASRLQRGQYLTAGETRGRAVHAPGLTPYVPAYPRNVRPGYQQASIYEGMQRRGRGTATRYLTFRTMTERSSGWWVPSKAPQPIAVQTVREIAPAVFRLLTAAAQADVVTLIDASLSAGGTA